MISSTNKKEIKTNTKTKQLGLGGECLSPSPGEVKAGRSLEFTG